MKLFEVGPGVVMAAHLREAAERVNLWGSARGRVCLGRGRAYMSGNKGSTVQ